MGTIPLQTKTNSFLKIEDDSIAEILVIVYSMDVMCNLIFQLLERQWNISIQNILQIVQKKKNSTGCFDTLSPPSTAQTKSRTI